VQAVTIAAMFNHHTRVADATGVEGDYPSPLPRIAIDPEKEPQPLPEKPPPAKRSGRFSLALRPRTAEMIARLGAHVRAPSEGLSARERALAGRAACLGSGDAERASRWDRTPAEGPRETAIAAYATKLTRTPWRMREADLAALRAHGFEDRGLLDLIAVVAVENLAARVRLALG
jgi:alkylhydroperoxidase family enzyme